MPSFHKCMPSMQSNRVIALYCKMTNQHVSMNSALQSPEEIIF